jgi:hypothetical protein
MESKIDMSGTDHQSKYSKFLNNTSSKSKNLSLNNNNSFISNDLDITNPRKFGLSKFQSPFTLQKSSPIYSIPNQERFKNLNNSKLTAFKLSETKRDKELRDEKTFTYLSNYGGDSRFNNSSSDIYDYGKDFYTSKNHRGTNQGYANKKNIIDIVQSLKANIRNPGPGAYNSKSKFENPKEGFSFQKSVKNGVIIFLFFIFLLYENIYNINNTNYRNPYFLETIQGQINIE